MGSLMGDERKQSKCWCTNQYRGLGLLSFILHLSGNIITISYVLQSTNPIHGPGLEQRLIQHQRQD